MLGVGNGYLTIHPATKAILLTSGVKAILLSSLRNHSIVARSSQQCTTASLPSYPGLFHPLSSTHCLSAATRAVAETCIRSRLTLLHDAVCLGTEAVEVNRAQCIVDETFRVALVERLLDPGPRETRIGSIAGGVAKGSRRFG